MMKHKFITLTLLSSLLLIAAAAFTPVFAADGDAKLMVWLRAEDLVGKLADGERVALWTDMSGQGNTAASEEDFRPTFRTAYPDAGNQPAVVFAGAPKADPPVIEEVGLPIHGEWQDTTWFIVGTQLWEAGLFNTHNRAGSLRMIGAVQSFQTAVQHPFRALREAGGLGLATVTVDYDGHEKTVATYANGELQGENTNKNDLYGIIWGDASLGSSMDRRAGFNGSINEVLIYKGLLSDKQRAAVEAYLQKKYDLPGAPAGAPEKPVLVPDNQALRLPQVDARPPVDGLAVWARGEDLLKMPAGAAVTAWPNAAGDKPLTAEPTQAPVLVADAVNGRPAVSFDSFGKKDRIDWLHLPLEGEMPEITVLMVGRGLTIGTLMDTAESQPGALVLYEQGTQVPGTGLNAVGTYPLRTAYPLAVDPAPSIIATRVGTLPQGGMYLTTHVNGQPQYREEDPRADRMIVMKNPRIGALRKDATRFDGDVAEVLVYNRALSDAELQQAFDYLEKKYSIPQATPEQADYAMDCRSRWSIIYPKISAKVSWLGNTFAGEDGSFQSGVNDVAVRPDGTVLVSCSWDERGKTLGIYEDGKVVQPEYRGGGATNAIAIDDEYVYRAFRTWRSPMTVMLRRFRLEDMHEAPWKALKGDKYPTWKHEKHDNAHAIRGLAVANGEVYAAFYSGKELIVFDKETGQEKRRFEIDNPSPRLAAGLNGNLWVGGEKGVVEYTAAGKATGRKIEGVVAGDVFFDPQGRLLVAENGERQQIIFYDVTGNQPREVDTLGERGGVLFGERPGEITPDRLYMPKAIGMDAAGNYYIVGGRALRAYSPEKEQLYMLYCTEFVTCGDVDPASDGTDIYTPRCHFRYEPGQVGGSEWKWVGVTHNGLDYDGRWASPRNGVLRRLDGRLYHFNLDGRGILVRRQIENGDLMVPCAYVFHHYWGLRDEGTDGLPREAAQFVWADRNGDGHPSTDEVTLPPEGTLPTKYHQGTHYVDETGDLWMAERREGIRYMPLLDMLDNGTPVYDYASEKIYPRPNELIEVKRALYDAKRDVMYMLGTSWEYSESPGEHLSVDSAGRQIVCYENYTKPTRALRWSNAVPNHFVVMAAEAAYDNGLLLLGDVESSSVLTYDTETGKLLGVLEPEGVGSMGWIDVRSGVRAFCKSNGETIVITESCVGQLNVVYTVPKRPWK